MTILRNIAPATGVVVVLLATRLLPVSSFRSLHKQGVAGHNNEQTNEAMCHIICHNSSVQQSVRTSRRPVLRLLEKKHVDEKSNNGIFPPLVNNPGPAVAFSILMTLSGAALGPFLDSFHSAFGVLQYDEPITMRLWGTDDAHPALITAWWVPELFGLAGFLIGWLYLLLDRRIGKDPPPSPPKIMVGISLFTFQYWLSGAMFQLGVDRSVILNVMSLVAATGFWVLDGTMAGFLVSAATALGGPAVEVGLLTTASYLNIGGYHYHDPGETGYFPLWIMPIYFLGGAANGNLAKGYWSLLNSATLLNRKDERKQPFSSPGCLECNDTRCIPCPNCDGIGAYIAMGGKSVKCTSCQARGFVVCRRCFHHYDEDPQDVEAIRELMSKMPD